MKKIITLIFLLNTIFAFGQKVTLYGNVTDSLNGESLIGVTVYMLENQTSTTTNEYGFYSLSAPAGNCRVSFSYLGYYTKTIEVNLSANKKMNIALSTQASELQEVVVSTEGQNISQTQTSITRLNASTIKSIPAMGEVDLIKAVQLLPGVQPLAEGSSNFSVRGGGYDQNLILLDEATIYSSSHLLGFFSIFNNDAVKDVQLYKGDIPATFGGRLSSLMEVRTKDGNNQRFSTTGGIGTIASRITLESPIVTENISFLASARRTYADLFLKLSQNENLKKSQLYFYDINAKLNFKIGGNDRIFLAGYFGEDKFANNMAGMTFGNQTATLRWTHIFSSKIFSNFTFLFSNYNYAMQSSITEQMAFDWKSRLMDFGGKLDFTYNINSENTLKFGYQATHHSMFPGKGGGEGENSLIQEYSLPTLFSLEHALYASHQISFLKNKFNIRYGLRFSLFHNLGNGNASYILENHVIADSVSTQKGKIYNTHYNFEPRISLTYMLNKKNSFKMSYSHSAQYIQIASNSTAGSPLDLWFSASQNVKPQICDQIIGGYFRNFWQNKIEASLEIYYKDFRNVIDFKERANLFGNAHLEQELRIGKGYSYGIEVMVRKNSGKLTGWASYTFSRSYRKIEDINDGEQFLSPYDKPHNISIVLNYEILPRLSASASWVYSTGAPVTYPVGRYQIDNRYIPIPSKRNAYRFPDYHRLDLSVTCKLSKPEKKFQHELNVSIYNAYARKNAWTIYFVQDKDNSNKTYAEMLYLFSVVPSITWNFKW
ncbi:MAG: TonB-dependent receptor [Prevotellaceae bacterium]|nr:TonB-dependent receptor [Prevotellaceae bacterium]